MDSDDPLVKRAPTLNPYLRCGRQILRRVAWDIHIESWRSRRLLRNWRDIHKGKKAVILCNGPSLLKVDFELLKASDCFIFGLNKIHLLFDRTSVRPNCIVAVNRLVIEQTAEFYNSTEVLLFLDSVALRERIVKPAENMVFLHSTNVQGFAKDCSMSINQGFTVTYVALQLAFHMGFDEVALVGADHSYGTQGAANKAVSSSETDNSHFDSSYFSGGVQWHLPDLFESEVSYGRAAKMFKAHDRVIYNCTEGGELNVFPRVTLRDFLERDTALREYP